jgi:hypothetical protein
MNSGKLIPTRYMPLELELQLSSTVSDYLVAGANFSSNFTLQNIQLIYDVYESDPAVSESFFPKFSFNAQRPRLGWSAKIADCHLSGFGSPPSADQLIAIEKILERSTETGDAPSNHDE